MKVSQKLVALLIFSQFSSVQQSQAAPGASALKDATDTAVNAVAPNPEPYQVKLANAQALLEKKQYKEAAALYTQALAELGEPQDRLQVTQRWGMLTNRSICYEHLKEFDKALADCNEKIKLSSPLLQSMAYQHRASLYKNSGHLQLAIDDLNKAIGIEESEKKPGSPDFVSSSAYHTRGLCFEQLGDLKKALADMDVYIHDHEGPHPLKDRARIYEKLGKKTLAANDLAAAKKFEDEWKKQGVAKSEDTFGSNSIMNTFRLQTDPPKSESDKSR